VVRSWDVGGGVFKVLGVELASKVGGSRRAYTTLERPFTLQSLLPVKAANESGKDVLPL